MSNNGERYSQIAYRPKSEINEQDTSYIPFAIAGTTKQVNLRTLSSSIISKLRTENVIGSAIVFGDSLKTTNGSSTNISINHEIVSKEMVNSKYISHDWLADDTKDVIIDGHDVAYLKITTINDSTFKIELNRKFSVYLNKVYKTFQYTENGNNVVNGLENIVIENDIYIYVTEQNGELTFSWSKEQLLDTKHRMVVAHVNKSNTGVLTINSSAVGRFGPYRVSKTPLGSSAPSSTGSASQLPTYYWLMEDY